MYDSTPNKIDRPHSQNEILHLASLQRSSSQGTSQQCTLDLIALWNDETELLKEAVFEQSDWGPFELINISPAYYDAYSARRVLCRFIYHGEQKDRNYFEQLLRDCLNQITAWRDAPRFLPADTD